MAAMDYSSSFAGINSALVNLGKTLRANQERDELKGIAADVAGGALDYNAAAGKLLSLGRPDTAVEFLKMGEARRQRTAGEDAARALGGAISGVDAGAMSRSTSGAATGSALPTALNMSESGGNWQAQNDEVGADGARGHFGRAQFGQARLQEAANAGAIPSGTTPDQFMQSPQLQRAAENWHFGDIDQTIRNSGMGAYIGKNIGGVPITLDGMRAVAHLGGKGGLAKFLASGGRYNPSDANGTSLLDYLRLGATGVRSASADMLAPGAANASLDTGQQGFAVPGQPAMTGRTFDAITATDQPLQPAFMAEGASQPWMGSALTRLGQRSTQSASAPRRGQVLPPSRPHDLSPDLPAPGAVQAMGQMPSPIDRAGAVDIDPNSNDAGALRGLVQSEEARRGLSSGAGIMNPLDNFRPAASGPAATQSGPRPAPFVIDHAADLPAPGSAPAQGGLPSTGGVQPMLTKDMPPPQTREAAREFGATRTMEMNKGRVSQLAAALSNPNLPANARAVGEIFLKEALEQSKAPDSLKEFMYSRGMGWTTAKNPAEYAAEKEKAKKSTAEDNVEERQAAAARAGLKPGDAGYQGFILTGKMPREDMGPLSATDKKAIMEADDAVQSAQTAIKSLQDAKKLSPQALGGWGASTKAAIANNLWDGIVPDRLVGSPQQGQATAELDNVVTSQALAQLKSIFGAAPTEGERKILLDIQGSIGQPDNVRQKVFDRGIELAQRRLGFNRQRAAELRGGDYYKSPEKRSQGGNSEPQGSAPVPGARQAGDGNWYVPDPNRQGKYLRVN